MDHVCSEALDRLLQPLDVRVFRTFKAAYCQRYTTARTKKLGGMLNTAEWVRLIGEVVNEIFMERTWEKAFEVTGIAGGQRKVSEWIRQHAGFTEKRRDAKAESPHKMRCNRWEGSGSKCHVSSSCWAQEQVRRELWQDAAHALLS